MNTSTLKLLVSGMVLLCLSACAPYPHAYYPAGGAYSSSYGVVQRSYYGGYPYRYDNYSYPYTSNYRYDHNGYHSHPAWNNFYVRPNSSRDYNPNHPDRKHQQFGYQDAVPAYRDHKDRHNLHGNNNWNKPPTVRSWEHNNPQQGRSNLDRQNNRSDDRRNQIREQRHYEHGNNNRVYHENHEQARTQRESRRRDH